MDALFTLVSHRLCPYVQRAAIVLAEKNVEFKRIDIDLSNKPDWFLQMSPLGKTPVLLVDEVALFESAVICEYLDETIQPAMHPDMPLDRARHRAWIEFGSSILNAIGLFYSAGDEQALISKAKTIAGMFEQLEAVCAAGPYFSGERFTMVDAVFGPIFRYFDVLDTIADFGIFANAPKVRTWRSALATRHSVRNAVSPDYDELLREFLHNRASALSARMQNPHRQIAKVS